MNFNFSALSRIKRVPHRLLSSSSVLLGQSFSYSLRQYAHHTLSFSQEGEDGVLSRLFERQDKGFYVDVGAHHPQRFSNTYKFYLRGWSGINIDPLPGSKEKFDKLRDRDINLQLGVANQEGVLTYYSFEEPALNTFDSKLAKTRPSKLIEISKIPVKTLSNILIENLPSEQPIDFLSVDVEGLDLEVLRSNDWSRFRPRVVLAESLKLKSIQDAVVSPVSNFMLESGYCFYAKTVNTLFYIDETI